MVLSEQELDMVNGGSWGFNNYHNEDEYHAVGISTDWTGWYNQFIKDRFYFRGQQIKGDTASKIVFFVRATNPVPGKFSIGDALNYAVTHSAEYENDMKAANK